MQALRFVDVPSEQQLRKAIHALWRDGFNTMDIAALIGQTEIVVVRLLNDTPRIAPQALGRLD